MSEGNDAVARGSEPTREYGAPWLPVTELYNDSADMVNDMKADYWNEYESEMGPRDDDGSAWTDYWSA
jgi:hypothetical protein